MALFLSIFSFLFFTGTLNSGYHFIDDHEMILIDSSLNKNTYVETYTEFMKNDLNIRFRPFYFLHRIFEVKVFNINFCSLSFYIGILAFLSFSFIYLGARKLRHSFFDSFLFVLLSFTGAQMAIWWRLGPAETIGMFFLSLSFLFLARGTEKKEKWYSLNNILFSVCLIIASLSKEIFVLIIPIFCLYKIWREKETFNITLKQSLNNNCLLVLPTIVMLIELWIIKFIVGTNQIGYAGAPTSPTEFMIGVKGILVNQNALLPWMNFIKIFIFLYFLHFLSLVFINGAKKIIIIQSIRSSLPYLIFALLIVLPSIFMYAKSGMTERYLLPATLGLAFFVMGILHNTKDFLFKVLMYLAILIFLFSSFTIARTDAIAFAKDGISTNILLSSVKEYSNSNSKILLVADPVLRYELSYSLRTYLSYYGYNNLYAYPIKQEYKTDFEKHLEKGWMDWFGNRKITDMIGTPDLILMLDKDQAEFFFKQTKIPETQYKNIISQDDKRALFIKNL